MALVGIELVTHVSEPDALTTRPPPCYNLWVVTSFFGNLIWLQFQECRLDEQGTFLRAECTKSIS